MTEFSAKSSRRPLRDAICRRGTEWPPLPPGSNTMTTTQRAGGASPVDFATFGDYGDFRRKQPQPATGEFVRPAYPFRGRVTADGSSGF